MKKKKFFKSSMIVAITIFLIASASPLMAGEGRYGGILITSEKESYSKFGIPWMIKSKGYTAIQMAAQPLIQPTNVFGQYESRLATNWELASDKSHFIFKLRKGVKFQDGTDFNAQSVKFNIEEAIKAKRPMFKTVESVDVVDAYTVKVNLSSHNLLTINDFSIAQSCIISPTAYEKNGKEWMQDNPVGTGPFKLKELKARTHTKWVKNQDYWDKGFPYLDEVHQMVMPDPMTREASFIKGDTHVIYEVDETTATGLIAKGFSHSPILDGKQMMIYWNSVDPNSIWSNHKVRQAFEYAIDKASIAEVIGKKLSKPSYECLWGLGKSINTGIIPRKYDPAKARQLLKEAGYPNGVKAELITRIPTFDNFFKAIQGAVKEGGFNLELVRIGDAPWAEIRFGIAPTNTLLYDSKKGGAVNVLHWTKVDLYSDSLYYGGMKKPDGFDNGIDRALNSESIDGALGELAQLEKAAYNYVMFTPLWTYPIINMVRPEVKWVKSEREDPFNSGGNKQPRMEYLYLDK